MTQIGVETNPTSKVATSVIIEEETGRISMGSK